MSEPRYASGETPQVEISHKGSFAVRPADFYASGETPQLNDVIAFGQRRYRVIATSDVNYPGCIVLRPMHGCAAIPARVAVDRCHLAERADG